MNVCLINLWDKGAMLHYAAQLANSLVRVPGNRVTIMLPCSARSSTPLLFDPAVDSRYIDVITESSLRQFLRLPQQMLRLPSFIAEVAKLRPDVIHVTAAHVWLLFTLPWLARRYPIVSTLHDAVPHPGLDNTWRKRLEIETLIRHSDAMFVHGQQLAQAILMRHPGLSAEQVHVIPLGDFALFDRWRTGLPEEPGTILFFGRIREYKGLSDLAEAYSHLVQVFAQAKLIIAGEGPLGEVAKVLETLPNCEVHNRFIADEEVATFFERASVVVCPYTEASQSAVVSLAYAFCKAVVATRVGCLPDVVEDGQTGYLVPPRDPQALAEAIAKLLQDQPLRSQMGQNAYRKMKNELGWDQIALTTLDVYHGVIRQFGRNRGASEPISTWRVEI